MSARLGRDLLRPLRVPFQLEERMEMGSAILASATILALVFLVWELIEKKFFAQIDMRSIHLLYITRGLMTGLLMGAWAAWFVMRSRRSHRRKERELQAQLFQAEKLSAIGEMVSGFAHEINNPVGIVASRLELLLAAGPRAGPPEFREDLLVLKRHTDRIADISRQLLNFTRNAPIEFAPVSVNEAIRNVLALMDEAFRKQRVRVAATLDPALPGVFGAQTQLEQVVLNLLKNSVEALEGRDGAEIRVESRRLPDSREVVFSVDDNGPGIPPGARDRVFDPFFTTKQRGTGLGLSVSYGIVQQHRGVISVDAARDGARFVVRLPAIDGEPAEAAR